MRCSAASLQKDRGAGVAHVCQKQFLFGSSTPSAVRDTQERIGLQLRLWHMPVSAVLGFSTVHTVAKQPAGKTAPCYSMLKQRRSYDLHRRKASIAARHLFAYGGSARKRSALEWRSKAWARGRLVTGSPPWSVGSPSFKSSGTCTWSLISYIPELLLVSKPSKGVKLLSTQLSVVVLQRSAARHCKLQPY